MVLSNNDGCVVARSNEAKELGVKAGTPFFQLKELFPGEEIIPFSSNYELYADITGRVMSLVRKAVPSFVRYSIDEGFCDLSGMEHLDLKKWGEEEVKPKAELAWNDEGEFNPGEHCQFCKARAICRARAKKALDGLSKFKKEEIADE